MQVPRLGLSSHLALPSADLSPTNKQQQQNSHHDNQSHQHHGPSSSFSSSSSASSATATAANTSMDDYLAHVHPGAMTVSDPIHTNLNESFEQNQRHLHLHQQHQQQHPQSETQQQQQQKHQVFGSEKRPGSVSPRPSKGVPQRSVPASASAASSSSSNSAAHHFGSRTKEQLQEAAIRRQASLRRSPSMPSASASSSSFEEKLQQQEHEQEHQKRQQQQQAAYNFDLKRCEPLSRLHHLSNYQLGSGGELNEASSNNNNRGATNISALAASSRGTCLCWGDAAGRVFFLERGEENCGPMSTTPTIFSPVHGASAYAPFVDPLSSQDVKPQVNAIAFLPEVSPSSLILTANEKIPKLWRLVKVPSLAPPLRAVDLIGTRQVGPLTVPEQPTSVLKEVRKFNVDHEYNIHSLCVIRDGTQFVSADEVTLRLWNVELEHRGLLLSTEQPQQQTNSNNDSSSSSEGVDGGGQATTTTTNDVADVINVVHSAPHAPHSLLVGMSSGQVRLVDLRCNLRVSSSSSLSSASSSSPKYGVVVGGGGIKSRACDGLYRAVCAATLGCDLSLCGNLIAHRDVTCMHLFDIRRASSSASPPSSPVAAEGGAGSSAEGGSSSLVNRWVLQDHVARHFGNLYQLGSLFEKVSVRFVGSRLVTGGFGECVITASAVDSGENPHVLSWFNSEPANVEVPLSDELDASYTAGETNSTTDDEDVARIYKSARQAKGEHQTSTRVTFLRDNDADDEEQEQQESAEGGGGGTTTKVRETGEVYSLKCHTLDKSAERQEQHHHDVRDWRRVSKICTIPTVSWISSSSSSSSSSGESNSRLENCAELLAACGDSVHHVAIPLK